ncbi:hypothetical protein [Candidatus Marithrix sp. Canyon 246]|uniref:hypothetical protein n=1 Tax=Candidatus Marithrix sp. Canyon 246 TaxID=1827136 RepID=UPI0009F6C8D6|nr:hypothetical protein [Candidatus Marithrix sp. Canyon 246]
MTVIWTFQMTFAIITPALMVGAFAERMKFSAMLIFMAMALDVFGVHAVGGIIGAILTGVFAATVLGGAGFGDGNSNIAEQVTAQFIGVIATIIFTTVMTFIILKVIDIMIGLRVDEEQETEGLDITQHEERGYIL